MLSREQSAYFSKDITRREFNRLLGEVGKQAILIAASQTVLPPFMRLMDASVIGLSLGTENLASQKSLRTRFQVSPRAFGSLSVISLGDSIAKGYIDPRTMVPPAGRILAEQLTDIFSPSYRSFNVKHVDRAIIAAGTDEIKKEVRAASDDIRAADHSLIIFSGVGKRLVERAANILGMINTSGIVSLVPECSAEMNILRADVREALKSVIDVDPQGKKIQGICVYGLGDLSKQARIDYRLPTGNIFSLAIGDDPFKIWLMRKVSELFNVYTAMGIQDVIEETHTRIPVSMLHTFYRAGVANVHLSKEGQEAVAKMALEKIDIKMGERVVPLSSFAA